MKFALATTVLVLSSQSSFAFVAAPASAAQLARLSSSQRLSIAAHVCSSRSSALRQQSLAVQVSLFAAAAVIEFTKLPT
jgi:hypothetical protein